MAALYALADLHLSGTGDKPMDIFGPAWRNHAGRMAQAWDELIDEGDIILLPGDLSWAKTLEEAGEDLAWIGRRPGRKIILRGNHDYWWGSLSKVRKVLPESIAPLQNNSYRAGGVIVVGARGWTSPDDPVAGPEDRKIYMRELERLKLSIDDADKNFGRELPRIAMLHYPPWIAGREPTGFVDILREGGVSVCVYGHLHGEDHRLGISGTHREVRFMLVAADAVGFAPVEVEY